MLREGRRSSLLAAGVLAFGLLAAAAAANDPAEDGEDFKRLVQASWYGPAFAGRLTASGDVFDPNALTAAHPWLPFGTKLDVTSLHNGRTVTVVVNDRGPYVANRKLDLSQEAARRLDMVERGVATVLIERR